jgi:hypothetical protein
MNDFFTLMKNFNEKDGLYYPKMIEIMDCFLMNLSKRMDENNFRKIWKLYKNVKFSLRGDGFSILGY